MSIKINKRTGTFTYTNFRIRLEWNITLLHSGKNSRISYKKMFSNVKKSKRKKKQINEQLTEDHFHGHGKMGCHNNGRLHAPTSTVAS